MNKNNFPEIKKLLKFVYNNKHSDFYRERFKKAKFNPLTDFKSIKDFKKVPFLLKSELLNVNVFKLLFVEEKNLLSIKSTSGTTGKPLYVFCSKLDGPQKKIIKSDFGIALSLVKPISMYHHSITAESQNFWMLYGDIHNLPSAAKIAEEFRVETLFTSPTMCIVFKDYLKDYPAAEKSLKYIYLFGELITPAKKKILQKLYPNTTIFLTYGSTETQVIGSQCEYLAKINDQIYYHPRYDYQHLEVIDPQTGEEVKTGEKGEMVITPPTLRGTPIIRYKIGDLVSLKEGKDCPCGFKGPLLQIWGRVGSDIVKAGGFELRGYWWVGFFYGRFWINYSD